MNCERYREWMSQMLDGELSEPEKTELMSHIAVCPECARIYNAFVLVSSSLDPDAEPPETLCTDVMNAVRARSAKVVPIAAARKRRAVWVRLGALAACLAVVAFAAVKSGVFARGQSASLMVRSADVSAQTESAAAGTADAADPQADATAYLAENSVASPAPGTAADGSDAGSGGAQAPLAQAAPAPDLYGADNSAEGQATALGVSKMELFSGDVSQPDREPIATVTDEASLRTLMDLLEFSADADGITCSGDAVFLITVTPTEGDAYTVSVWIVDGKLCCLSSRDDTLYVAAGDAGDLFSFIAAA